MISQIKKSMNFEQQLIGVINDNKKRKNKMRFANYINRQHDFSAGTPSPRIGDSMYS